MKKIYLRRIQDSDTANIVRWRNSDSVRKNLIDQAPITEDGHRKYLEKYVYTKQRFQFIICVKDEDGDFDIGSCFVKDIDFAKEEAEVGIFIGESAARGKGYAKYALSELIKFCFFSLNLKTIVLWVLDTNLVAINVYTKLGFEEKQKDEKGFIYMRLDRSNFLTPSC